ncbi:MAG: acyltransferase family protein [Clostridia bacterium]|nr:acyltransferase family protein [Clostridia bacterium]
MPTENQRLYKLDNLKLLLIFLVVLGHVADLYAETSQATGYLRYIIYTFHMPLFLFVSGLVGKRSVRERRYSHIATYFGLYIFIKILNFAANWATAGVLPKVTVFADRGEPWYAFCLFAFGFITICVDKLKPAYVLILSVLLACLAGYDKTVGDLLCLSRIIVFYPFYYLGYCLEPQKVCAFFSKKRLIPIALLILAAGVTATILLYDRFDDFRNLKFIFTARNAYQTVLKYHEFGFAHRLLCYTVSMLVGGAFFALVPKRRLGFLTKIGARSVQIYALQRVMLILYFRLLNKPFHLEGYFTSKLILYELLVSLGVTAVCALPIWNPLFNAIMRPFRQEKTE